MACLCGGGTTSTGGTSSSNQSGTSNQTADQSGSQRAYLPPEILDALKKYGLNVGDSGLNPTQSGALSGINGNAGALDAAGNAATGTGANATGAAGDALNYLKNQQNNGSFTLGKYFPNNPTITASSAADPTKVAAGTGADYAGAYTTPLQSQYVNASLNDYDTGVDRGFNALRAGNASAFGNKRTGVAEGTFLSDAARQRGNLSAGLNLNAFNTAAGFGQTDASRALTADTTNVNNLLNNNQFNANLGQSGNMFNSNLIDSRQKSDIASAQAGEASRLGTATSILGGANTLAGINNSNVNNATSLNSSNLQNQLAAAGLGNISASQLAQLVQLWGVGTGSDTTGRTNTNGTFNGTSNGTTTGTSTNPGNLFGTLGGLAIGAGGLGWNPFAKSA